MPSFPCSFRRSLGWSHGCFGWQQGMSAVTGGSCALDHRSDLNQTAAATAPERQHKVVGMLAAMSHVISPRIDAGPPVRPVIRRRLKTVGCALNGLCCSLEPSVSHSLLPGIAAMLVVTLSLVWSTSLRGLTFYLPRAALRAHSALYKVCWDTPLAATAFGSGFRAEGSDLYSMRVLRVPSLGYSPALRGAMQSDLCPFSTRCCTGKLGRPRRQERDIST